MILRLMVLAFSLPRFQQPGPRLVQWEPDAEARPLPHAALHFNPASVLADDALNDHQSQAGALLFGRIKRLEDALDLFGRDAAAGIRDA